MTPEQFAYWLQGFTELTPDMERPSAAQWQAIKDHLQTVFVKVTPPMLSSKPEHLSKLLDLMRAKPDLGLPMPTYPGLADRVTC